MCLDSCFKASFNFFVTASAFQQPLLCNCWLNMPRNSKKSYSFVFVLFCCFFISPWCILIFCQNGTIVQNVTCAVTPITQTSEVFAALHLSDNYWSLLCLHFRSLELEQINCITPFECFQSLKGHYQYITQGSIR